ncbi:MAG: recombinase family protein [bacterium]
MLKVKKNKIENYNVNSYEGREGLIYPRVSSDRQKSEGHGLESQEERCMAELARLNVPYSETFPDSYTGGGDFMERPAMKKMLSYIDAHPHKKYLVIFDDIKRFARDTEFHFKLRTAFMSRDVSLKCLNYNFDDSPEGRFIETIMAGQAELERHQNKRQVIQKMKSRLELGYWTFGSKKGYTLTKNPEHGKIAISNEEGEILKQALEGFANGTFIRKIDACRFLVEKGFWEKQSPEKYIDKLAQIIKDPFYAGFIEYPAWEVSRRIGKHKGIITLETFELNQKRLGKLDLGKRIRTDITDEFPLRGLLVCASCENHLTATWCSGRSKKHPYYFCQNKNCESYWKVIKKETVESEFNEILKKTTLKKDVSTIVQKIFDKVWIEEVENIQKLQDNLNSKKTVIEKKISELTNLVISTKSESLKRIYEAQIEAKGEEIEQIDSDIPINNTDLKTPYRTALDKATGLLKSPYAIWLSLDTKEQQNLFYFIFEKKLLYSKKDSYRTNKSPYAIRLFEEFVTTNSLDVEMTRIELVCRRIMS